MERRRHTRHALTLPVHLRETEGRTRDLSVDGVYFETPYPPAAGEKIDFAIVFDHSSLTPVRLVCSGVVVRVDPIGETCGVATSIDSFSFAISRNPKSLDH